MSKNKFSSEASNFLFAFFFALNKKIWSRCLENQSSNELETCLPSYFLATGSFTDVLNIY